jgi:hypothetical protein
LNTRNELVRRKASHIAIDGGAIAVLIHPDRRISDLESLRDHNVLAPADIMKDLDLHDIVAVQRHGLQAQLSTSKTSKQSPHRLACLLIWSRPLGLLALD